MFGTTQLDRGMANTLYPLGKQAFLSGAIDLTSATVKVAMVTSSYSYSSSHQYYSDVTPGSNVVGTPQTLASKTVTNGVFDAADISFVSLSATATINYLVVYKDSGSNSTSPLIALLDSGTGLPISLTTSVTEVDVVWDNGSNKVFSL